MRARVDGARVARLATADDAGRPHLVPCCFALDGDRLFTGIDEAKPKSTLRLRRLRNIRDQPSVTALVDHYDEDWSALWWIRLDGTARVFDPGSPEHDRGTELLVAKYPQYDEVSLAGPMIVIEIDRWAAWP